jgi:hypothetical protein
MSIDLPAGVTAGRRTPDFTKDTCPALQAKDVEPVRSSLKTLQRIFSVGRSQRQPHALVALGGGY